MSVLPFLGICFGAAALSLLTRTRPSVSLAIGLAGLAAALVAALAIGPGDTREIGGMTLASTEYQRLFLALGVGAGLLLCLIGLATAWQRNIPAAMLAGLGSTGLALGLAHPIPAVVAAMIGGLAGILVTLVAPITQRDVQITARELRAVAVAGVLTIMATAWIDRPLGPLALEPAVFGLAYLAMAVALAIRFGAIPFHVWAARLADSAPEIALPLLMAWGPAGLAVVGLAWADRSIAPLTLPLEVERGTVLAIAGVSLVLGSFAAWIQDDVEHVVGYSIVQDGGFVLLALATLDPAAWVPGRTWILIFVVVKSAFAAWALAVRSAFGTRKIDELGGWARRAPILGLALLVIIAATIGWPGFTSYEVRAELIRLPLEGPLEAIVWLGALSSLIYYVRLLRVGLARPTEVVAAGADERPRWPMPIGQLRLAAALEGDLRSRLVGAGRTGRVIGLRLVREARPAWRLNRAPIAASLVLVLSGIAFSVAAGGLGGPAAAGGLAPGLEPASEGPGAPLDPEPSPSPGESGAPRGSGAPGGSGAPVQPPGPDESVPTEQTGPGGPSFQPFPAP